MVCDMLVTAIHSDEGQQKLVKIGEGRKKHTVLLYNCGTGFIQLWRECLLVIACDMLYIYGKM